MVKKKNIICRKNIFQEPPQGKTIAAPSHAELSPYKINLQLWF